jgi:transcriptional regulator with XRE-family HTH domain
LKSDAGSKRSPRAQRQREAAFGAVLQEIRKEHDLSQEKLGFDSGYHRNYIGLLERGLKSPSLSTIMDLAETLDIAASEILRRVEERVPKGTSRRRSPK